MKSSDRPSGPPPRRRNDAERQMNSRNAEKPMNGRYVNGRNAGKQMNGRNAERPMNGRNAEKPMNGRNVEKQMKGPRPRSLNLGDFGVIVLDAEIGTTLTAAAVAAISSAVASVIAREVFNATDTVAQIASATCVVIGFAVFCAVVNLKRAQRNGYDDDEGEQLTMTHKDAVSDAAVFNGRGLTAGTVRRFSAKNGWGVIRCHNPLILSEESYEKDEKAPKERRDVRIYEEQRRPLNLAVDHDVLFSLEADEEAPGWFKAVQIQRDGASTPVEHEEDVKKSKLDEQDVKLGSGTEVAWETSPVAIAMKLQ